MMPDQEGPSYDVSTHGFTALRVPDYGENRLWSILLVSPEIGILLFQSVCLLLDVVDVLLRYLSSLLGGMDI